MTRELGADVAWGAVGATVDVPTTVLAPPPRPAPLARDPPGPRRAMSGYADFERLFQEALKK